MKITKVTIYFAVSIILAAYPSLWARQGGSANGEKSCKTFVKGFYVWYATRAFTPKGWLESSLQDRPSYFSPGLLSALRKYQKSPPNAQAEIDNLDFDPFLNAQDTSESYDVANCKRKGDHFFVDVYSVSSGKKRQAARCRT